jgi:hypothetical protein
MKWEDKPRVKLCEEVTVWATRSERGEASGCGSNIAMHKEWEQQGR